MNQGRRSIRFFEAAGRRYVADTDTGHAVPVSDAQWHALQEVCSDHPSTAVADPRRSVGRARRRADTLTGRGVLRLAGTELTASSPRSERPRLFVPGRFMARRNRVDPLVNRSHYHFLTALAQRADVCVPIESISTGSLALESMPDARPYEHAGELYETGVVLRLYVATCFNGPELR